MAAAEVPRIDPITFEVIRNALVAATDEMVLTLRRSAYSTNIKTRSDFSCAFFDAELRSLGAGLHAARAPRLDGRADAARDPRLRPREPRPGRRDHHQRPLPERRPPERRQPHLARASRRRAARLRREPRPPRRRRRRRPGEHRRVPRGVPGGRDHPAGQDRRGRADRRRRLRADPARQIRSKHETGGDLRAQIAANATGVAPAAGARRAARARDDRRDDGRAARLHRAAHARRARGAAARRLRGRGLGRHRRLHRRAGAPAGARRDRRRTASRFDLAGLRPAAARAGQLDLRADLLGVRLRAQVPDRPRPARQRRLLPADHGSTRRSGSVTNCTWPSPVVGGWETQTRLVDVDLPRAPAGAARAAAGGDEGDDVPRRLRRRRRGDRRATTASSRRSAAATAARLASDGPDAVQTHGQNTENAPVEETELNYPVRVARLSLVDDSEGPGRFRGGLGLRKDFRLRPADDVHGARRPDGRGPAGAFGGLDGRVAEYVLVRDGEERRLGAKATVELEAGRHRSATAPAAAAATARRRSATRSGSRATCPRAR